MFKKKPHFKPAAPLRSSERRRLADDIIREYGLEHLAAAPTNGDGETLAEEKDVARTRLRNALLPEDTQQARFSTTLGADGKEVGGTVYIGTPSTSAPTVQGSGLEQPQQHQRILWWSHQAHVYPTIYTLWSFPLLIPLLHTPAAVVAKMQGGADLMTPGLARGPPFPQGAGMGKVVAVAALERPSVPVVVGVCVRDVAGLGSVGGEKGRAVEGLHWVGDECWGWGKGWVGGLPERVGGWLEEEDKKQEGGDTVEGEKEGEDKNGAAEPVEAGSNNEDNASADPPKELTQPELDATFRNAFLYGLHQQLITHPAHPTHGLVFPLSPSFVMANLIQPFLPASLPQQQLQMKKTSWKTLRKFVKALEKEGVVRGKDQGGSETVVVEVFWGAEAVVGFRPYGGVKGMGGGKGEKGSTTMEGVGVVAGAGDESIGQTLQVVNFYKPTSKLAAIFSGAGVPPDEGGGTSVTKKQSVPQQMYFTPPEVREIVTQYLETENLISPSNKRLVTLNPVLGNAVFDGTGRLDAEILAKGTVPRDALLERILASMSPYHAILRNPSSSSPPTAADIKPKPGPAPKVRITLETRAGNKTVTKVSGLEVFHVEPRRLAEELKKVCAGSAGVEPLVGASKKGEAPVMEVMVQGPQREAVMRALEKRGVLGKWVEVLDRTKKGKGKG